jgi:predicted branched-subunit amino acid permease
VPAGARRCPTGGGDDVALNLRYLPIGISVAGGFTGGRLRTLLEAQLVVDESWAISIGGGRFDRRVLVGAGGLLYAGWLGGTALGVVGGSALGDPNRLGLAAAVVASRLRAPLLVTIVLAALVTAAARAV